MANAPRTTRTRSTRRKDADGKPVKPAYDGELIVLTGGPRDRFWYDAQQWLKVRAAAERMAQVHGHRESDGVLTYRKTRRHLGHPTYSNAGTVWAYSEVAG